MKATKQQLDKALRAPGDLRCFLFHGPDEAGSQALIKRFAFAIAPEAERVDLAGADLKSDPARLADEAASISMFGGARYILVNPAGEECCEAVGSLLQAGAAGNPVALVAGALKATSKLLKLVTAAPEALAFASYPPDAREWVRLVTELGRLHGLTVEPDVATRIAEGAGGNRALIEAELVKFALYLDTDADRVTSLSHNVVDLIGAARDEGDTTCLIDRVFDGDCRGAAGELARLRSEGTEGITLVRAALRRAVLLAKLQAGDHGASSGGKPMFWKDKDSAARQLPNWPADRLARCVSRLNQAERDIKSPGSLGVAAADEELLAIARQAGRRR